MKVVEKISLCVCVFYMFCLASCKMIGTSNRLYSEDDNIYVFVDKTSYAKEEFEPIALQQREKESQFDNVYVIFEDSLQPSTERAINYCKNHKAKSYTKTPLRVPTEKDINRGLSVLFAEKVERWIDKEKYDGDIYDNYVLVDIEKYQDNEGTYRYRPIITNEGNNANVLATCVTDELDMSHLVKITGSEYNENHMKFCKQLIDSTHKFCKQNEYTSSKSCKDFEDYSQRYDDETRLCDIIIPTMFIVDTEKNCVIDKKDNYKFKEGYQPVE